MRCSASTPDDVEKMVVVVVVCVLVGVVVVCLYSAVFLCCLAVLMFSNVLMFLSLKYYGILVW